jgi:hypothetical protein
MTDDDTTNPWREVPSSGDCVDWNEVAGDGNCVDWKTDEDWILITAFWQDIEHYWRDLALWQDRPNNWVSVNG